VGRFSNWKIVDVVINVGSQLQLLDQKEGILTTTWALLQSSRPKEETNRQPIGTAVHKTRRLELEKQRRKKKKRKKKKEKRKVGRYKL